MRVRGFPLCGLRVGGVVRAGDVVGVLVMLVLGVVWAMEWVTAPLAVPLVRVGDSAGEAVQAMC